MAKGGARPGAGRPQGSTNLPKLRDALTPSQIEALVKKAVEKANEGDSILLKFMLEQIYGKAPQPLVGDPDQPVMVRFDPSFDATTRKAGTGSK